MKPVGHTATPHVQPEAREFILARGLGPSFDKVRELAVEHFPTLRGLSVVLETDPEIRQAEQMCLLAVVEGAVAEVLDCEDAFTAAFCRRVAPEQRGFFVLTTIVAEDSWQE